ncbi:TolC family protein [Flavobacterium sp. CYK-4]|uniref:TolC family protein n=1 Tax=Flavobacterium lotistagni TaxID=2709660 RepID=UPI00140BD0CF|nr:TolC family protein [Flavobacterium lotistagni]NHM06221.1 TolC family protein [Flavobacterium lotistagni]
MKKKCNKIKWLGLILLCFIKTSAQQTLTLEDAVKIALENNYDIRIAANHSKITQADNTLGNAGMLPTVNASVVDNNGIQNLSQTRADGTTNSLDNAKNNSLTYGANLNWTIFDGFRMFARRDQLKELEKLGDIRLKQTILQKVSDVMAIYYDLVQQQQQLAALDSTIVISRQRLTLAQNRYTIGKASKLETLNAEVDLNTDTTTLLRQKELFARTKIELNEQLARDTKLDFKVSEEIQIDNQLLLANLNELASKQNPEVEALVLNKRISELQLKQIKGNRYPRVQLNTGYNFNESRSDLGFATRTSSQGLNYGFSATLPIFDGFNQHRNEKVAQLQVANSQIAIEQQNKTLESQLAAAFQTYQTNLELVKLEEKNQAIAKQNLEITLEKFRIGTIPTIEFRTAQLNYINAKVRFTGTQYQAKLSEIALKELAGNLGF